MLVERKVKHSKTMKIMRIFLLLLSLCFITGSLNAQILTGIIYDRENQVSVPGAYVYIEGSSLFDITNEEGKFEIKVNTTVNASLVVSHIGYNSTTVLDPFTSLPDTIFIEEKAFSLGEIVVQAGRYSRKQLIKAFCNEFLGTSSAANSCVIENEDNIHIWFNSRTNTLITECDEPIIILNRYLGFRLYINLEKFEVEYPGRQLGVGLPLIYFKSSIFFNDIDPINRRIAERRKSVFEGSRPFFLRALANNQLEKSGYWLSDNFNKNVSKIHECFTVTDSLDFKKVIVNQELRSQNRATFYGIPYWSKLGITRDDNENSEIILFTDTFYIDSWGQLSQPDDLAFTGYMGSLRFGDQLPLNYGIESSRSFGQ